MRLLAFNGSPRPGGNTSLLLTELLRGVRDAGGQAREIAVQQLDLKYCRGCLRCNILGRCALRGDDWASLSQEILAADALVFASPVYFHHVSAQLKKLLDRFRCFMQVHITPAGIQHSPFQPWRKKFVLLMSMGSSDRSDAEPAIELFRFMTAILGAENSFDAITGTRLAVARQVTMKEQELSALYGKLGLPQDLAADDSRKNSELLLRCYKTGFKLAGS